MMAVAWGDVAAIQGLFELRSRCSRARVGGMRRGGSAGGAGVAGEAVPRPRFRARGERVEHACGRRFPCLVKEWGRRSREGRWRRGSGSFGAGGGEKQRRREEGEKGTGRADRWGQLVSGSRQREMGRRCVLGRTVPCVGERFGPSRPKGEGEVVGPAV